MAKPLIVVGLDLGVTTGFCVGPVGGAPNWGAWRLAGPAAPPGARWCGLSNMLSDLIVTHRPAFALKEAPLRMAAQSSELVRRSQLGLHACAEEACFRQELDLHEEGADPIRKAIIGRSRWPKGADPKREVMAWCNDHGYEVRQPDAADAILVWLYACATASRYLTRSAAA
jgi:hypothetical protein